MTKPDLVEDDNFTGWCEQCGFSSTKRENFVFSKKRNAVICVACEKLDTTGEDIRPDTMKAGRWRIFVFIAAFTIMVVSYSLAIATAPDPADRPVPTARVNGIVKFTIMENGHWNVALHEFPNDMFWNPQNLGFRAGENVYLTVSPTSAHFHMIDNWEYGRRF